MKTNLKTNYFVEINPGEELEAKILAKKEEIISELGDDIVYDPTKSRFLRDPPHFTLMCARTRDSDGYLDVLRGVLSNFRKFEYEIAGIGIKETPEGLIEIRTVVEIDDQEKFKNLHLAVMDASLPFNTAGIYERFSSGFEGYALENINYCGFPGARNLYAPHASFGRVHVNLVDRVAPLINKDDFTGNYESGDIIFWHLPYEVDDPKATPYNPQVIELG